MIMTFKSLKCPKAKNIPELKQYSANNFQVMYCLLTTLMLKPQVIVTECFNVLALFNYWSRRIMYSFSETVTNIRSALLQYRPMIGSIVVEQPQRYRSSRLQQGLVNLTNGHIWKCTTNQTLLHWQNFT